MWHSLLEQSNFIALTSHEARRDGCVWKQEIHYSCWLCWDEEQIQSADSLVEPETFIIIITAPFTGLPAFLYGIIHHVISLTADYSSHQNGKKIQQRTAWALISSFFHSSFLLLLFCFVGELWVKTNPPVYFTSVSNSTAPNCRCGPVASATLQTVGRKQKEEEKARKKTASSCFQSHVNTGWVPAIQRLVTRKILRQIGERKECRKKLRK